jgi:hypothetical protein
MAFPKPKDAAKHRGAGHGQQRNWKRIGDVRAQGGFRIVALTHKAWSRCRRECCRRYDSRCVLCLCWAPLHDEEFQGFRFRAGHAHHRQKRWNRDDRQLNLMWVCWRCHDRLERPEAKPRSG